MVEQPNPNSPPSRINHNPARWTSFQLEPITSRPVNVQQVPSNLLSPDRAQRRSAVLSTRDPRSLIASILLDPNKEVRNSAVGRVVEIFVTDDYNHGLALQLAVTCHILNRSENHGHSAVAGYLAMSLIEATQSVSTPPQAFAQLVTAMLMPESLDGRSRERARIMLARDDDLTRILKGVAKQFLINDDADRTASGIFVDPSIVGYPERTVLHIDPITAILACTSRNADTTKKGVNTLAALCNQDGRSQFGLLALGFIATNPWSNIFGTQLSQIHFKEDDVANLVPWLVLRLANPSTLLPSGPAGSERTGVFGGAQWACISEPLLEKLDQYLATGNPLAVIGTCRLLRAFSLPNDRNLKDRACRVATAQLASLAKIRAAAGVSDDVLTAEISGHIGFLHRNLENESDLFSKGGGEETLIDLSNRGEFAVAQLVTLAVKFLGVNARDTVLSNLARQILRRVEDSVYTPNQAALERLRGLNVILSGLTEPIFRLNPEAALTKDILDLFKSINLVIGISPDLQVYSYLSMAAIGALNKAQRQLQSCHKSDFICRYLENLASVAMDNPAQPNAAHLSLLSDLLSSPPSPQSAFSPNGRSLKFIALSSVYLKRLTDYCCQVLNNACLDGRSSYVHSSAFDVVGCAVELLTNVVSLANNENWGSEDSRLSSDEVRMVTTSCDSVCNNPHVSVVAKLKASILKSSLQP